jgi:hypothetical protein
MSEVVSKYVTSEGDHDGCVGKDLGRVGPGEFVGSVRCEILSYFNSNKSPTRYNSFPVYYPDSYLQLNMFRASSCPSSGAQ